MFQNIINIMSCVCARIGVAACLAACVTVSAQANDLTFTGNTLPVVTVNPEASTGLECVYVVSSTAGVTASYTSRQSVRWQRFGSLGGGYAEDVVPVRDGDTYSVTLGTDDMGYIVTDGDRPHYYWIVNYANHPCRFDDLGISAEQDCGTAQLDFAGEADRITYYTINGAPHTLGRDIRLTYDTLVWDEGTGTYRMTETVKTLEYVGATIHTEAPLCDTPFTLAGDRFIEAWGEGETIDTDTYNAVAVEAHCTATQTERDNDNEQRVDGSALGGSAPADISFKAVVTDAVEFREWQFATDPEFEHIDIRINQDETEYTFREQGTTYVRYMAANAAGTCDYYSDTYEVTIGESALKCPNAFSPGATEGVNDEWKVSYKSLVSFECHIFNRWGVKMCELTDPSQGWDGKYKGKLVPAGVYFYVIKAKGADGKSYDLAGDINIIKYDANANPGTEGADAAVE